MLQRYRRRDLRADILGSRLDKPTPPPPKYKIKMSHIPLNVSDYTLDDLVKEFGYKPIYSKVFDTKEDRTFIIEFKTLDIMNNFVNKYNGFEIEENCKVIVEIFEQKSRKPKNRSYRDKSSRYGSHYNRISQGTPRRGISKAFSRRQAPKRPTLEELDAQLAAYMNSDSTTTLNNNNNNDATNRTSTVTQDSFHERQNSPSNQN